MTRPVYITERPISERLEAAARWHDFADRGVAAALRELALDLAKPVDRKEQRKRILRRVWAQHCSDLARSPAAAIIADRWAQLPTGGATRGTLDEMLTQIRALGFEPVSDRRIADLLDPKMDCGQLRLPERKRPKVDHTFESADHFLERLRCRNAAPRFQHG